MGDFVSEETETASAKPSLSLRMKKMLPSGRGQIISFALRSTAGAGIFVLSVVLFGAAVITASEHQGHLESYSEEISDAQSRIHVAEDTEAFLPDAQQANRWFVQARESGERVASIQNVYLEETGELDIESVPEYDEDAPDAGTAGQEPRTDEEREIIAQQNRDEALRGLVRQMRPALDQPSRSEIGFNAALRWDEEVSTMADAEDADLSGYQWEFQEPELYTDQGRVEAMWILRGPDDELVAWVLGHYDPQSSSFQNISIATAERSGE